jgi:hypothetical protein
MSDETFEVLDKNGNRRATAPTREAAAVELKRLKRERGDFAPFTVRESARETASTNSRRKSRPEKGSD